jgi:hypothetical protein
MERVKGIEPLPPAWNTVALPLSYTRRVTIQEPDVTHNASA